MRKQLRFVNERVFARDGFVCTTTGRKQRVSTALRAKARASPANKVGADAVSPKVRASSPTRLIFDGIVRGLYEGRYVAGQRLVEGDLVQAYGVSRGSVREALNRLAAEGIVILEPHRGASIRLLTRKDAQDMLMLLEMLLGLSARLAAENIDQPGVRKEFRQVFEALMTYRSRPDSFDLVRARNSFYRKLVEIGGNRELGRTLSGLHVHLLRVQFRIHQSEIEKLRFSDYQSIGEAVVAGNVRQAELAAKRHVRRIASAIAELPDSAFKPEA